MVTGRTTTVRLKAEDQVLVDDLKRRTGVVSTSNVIRFALREALREQERRTDNPEVTVKPGPHWNGRISALLMRARRQVGRHFKYVGFTKDTEDGSYTFQFSRLV
jgi:hypothetical protein